MVGFAIKRDGHDVVCEVNGLAPEEKALVRNTYMRLFKIDDADIMGNHNQPKRYIAGMKDGFMAPVLSTDEACSFFSALQAAGITFESPAQTRRHITETVPQILASLNGRQLHI